MKPYFSSFILLFGLSSCGFNLGIKNPKNYTESDSENFHKKIAQNEKFYKINPAIFLELYDSIYKNDIDLFSELSQPMQIIVFNNKYENITHLVNCNIGGLPLKWNRTQSFDNFPIQANGLREPNYKVRIDEIRQYITPEIYQDEINEILESYDYLYVVIYTRFVYSLSKGMFANIKNHHQKFKNEKVKYIFVSAEDLYVELDKRKR